MGLRMLLGALGRGVLDLFRPRARLAAENLALRQQLATLRAQSARPRLTVWDRVFWVVLRRIWSRWKELLQIVKPETVVRWHRKGWRLFWTWKSRRPPGRPRIDAEIRTLIRRMAIENPTWGAPRIHAELQHLGIDVSERTVSRYLASLPHAGSGQRWRTFLRNQALGIHAMDFFVVPTATFRVLYVGFIIEHSSRRIIAYRVMEYPRGQAVSLWLRDTYPFDEGAPGHMIHDRDPVFTSAAVTGLVHKAGKRG